MVDLGVLPAFVGTVLLFLAPPGPDMVFVATVGLHDGRRAAVRAIAGIGTGMSVYVLAVVVGLGGLARSHPHVLDAVKVVGAAYLCWLAVTTVRSARRGPEGGKATTGRPYLKGVVVSLTNPKLLLFFLAVLPQFLGDAEHVEAQLLMLGLVDVALEVVLYGAIGVLAGILVPRIAGGRRAGAVTGYLAAAVYLVLAGVVVVEVLAGGPS